MFYPEPETLANELQTLLSEGFTIRGHTPGKLEMGMPAFISAPVTCVSRAGMNGGYSNCRTAVLCCSRAA
jgi:hypothetical protein